ncbi:acyclic terpene utilization AtuA family protein [Nocardia sp. NPDC050175]|uniref:acyclic terpene utilization AtuA family protein n=1 Tax=Nocardia sp. NPDC050175 TaxID=3364317 RepID=UPI00379A92A5
MTGTPTPSPIRIGNASGFYGDRLSAFHEMLTGGDLDILTGDYLAELTMLILGKDLMRNPGAGYAKTFLRQLEQCMALAVDKGVRIVTNAGGLNPAGLAQEITTLAQRIGVSIEVAYVAGDDLRDRAGELGLGIPLTANAYLGAWGIAEALRAGADIVVTGRVTDASLAVGPAAAHFGWAPDDFDTLAGAVVAGHIIECGPQATGGNYPFLDEIDTSRPFGFPIAEVHADGSSIITKHPGTGGLVSVGTVTAQLLYEIGGPRYLGPDVTTRFDTVELEQVGPDRVRVHGTRGEAPPSTAKVCLNHMGGFRNQVTFVLTGLHIAAKADLIRTQLTAALLTRPQELVWTLAHTDRPDATTQEQASALLRVSVKDPDPTVAGRAFSQAAIGLALASIAGFTVTSPPGDASPFGIYTPAYVPAEQIDHVVVLSDGTRRPIRPVPSDVEPQSITDQPLPEPLSAGPVRRLPLGTVAGARSGDKGGDANVGVWARTDAEWRWLARFLTVDEFRRLLPETAELPVRRYVLANLRALNFVVEGLLGQGVAASTRFDPQAKGVGEWLCSRLVDIPEVLL